MPGIVVHGSISHRLLTHWLQRAGPSLDVQNEQVRNAFRAGAMAPDMGLLPRSNSLISDLAHYVQSGELVRQLVHAARNDVEQAFAWGWASHAVADQIVHPLVNRGAGELLFPGSDRSVSYEENPVAHVRIETGIDAACLARHPAGVPLTFRTCLDEQSISFVGEAFERTYGKRVIPLRDLLSAHRRSCRAGELLVHLVAASRPAPLLSGPLRWKGRLLRRTLAVVGRTSELFAHESLAYAFTHAVPPSTQLMAEAQQLIESVSDAFFPIVEQNAAELPDYNLDLGVLEDAAPYALRQATLMQLHHD